MKPINPTEVEIDGKNIIKNDDRLKYFSPPFNVTNTEFPIPTNKWWSNIILKKPSNLNSSFPIYSNPYSIKICDKIAPYGINISYPYIHRYYGPYIQSMNAIQYYSHQYITDIILTSEDIIHPKVLIDNWDDFGVHVKYMNNNGLGCIKTYLASGMVFITGIFTDNIKPCIKFPTSNIVSINNVNVLWTFYNGMPTNEEQNINTEINNQLINTNKIIVLLDNNEKWVIYFSYNITLSLIDGSKFIVKDTIKDKELKVRLAILPSNLPDNIYDPYKSTYLNGGHIEVLDTNSYRYVWKISNDNNNNESKFVHFGLTHHDSSFISDSVKSIDNLIINSTTRGIMKCYVSLKFDTNKKETYWDFKVDDDLSYIDFTYGLPNKNCLDVIDPILLQQEIDETWPMPSPISDSYYFNGKLFQKYGSLCLLAKLLYDTDTKYEDIFNIALDKYKALITSTFITNNWKSPLIYDKIYGGLCSSRMYETNIHIVDFSVDFGNTVYNDHHFHYGYWVVTCAIIKYLDPKWEKLNDIEKWLHLFIRDVYNFNSADKYFTRFRHFDWFLGHSYAHGVTPVYDGKDEESTSEDMNFFYGLYLWSKLPSISSNSIEIDKKINMYSELSMKILKKTVNTYFFLKDSNNIHPKDFINNKVTGIFYDNTINHTTFFGNENEKIHGIQMIPVSPATYYLRDPIFINEEYNRVLQYLKLTNSNSWNSILLTNNAVLKPYRNMAIHQLKSKDLALDDGLSQSWAIYMASTVPIFDPNNKC